MTWWRDLLKPNDLAMTKYIANVAYISEGSIHPKRKQSSLERVLGEVDRLVDDPEGDFQLLGLSEGCNSDLDGDRDGADPSYFDQSYLGP